MQNSHLRSMNASRWLIIVMIVLAITTVAVAQKGPVPAGGVVILPKPPHDVINGRDANLTQLATFAWQEFLALNWKASLTSERGTPDTTWTYSTKGPYPQLLVWQTYAQTTEFRPNGPLVKAWKDLGQPGTTPPTYSYQVNIAQGSGNPKNNLWNNLDEDNEIGSADIYSHYNLAPKAINNLVLFQVKVNKSEYEYLRVNYGADQNNSTGKLATTQAAVVSYIKSNQTAPYGYYAGATSTCSCPPDKAICLPCGDGSVPTDDGEGTIEVKTAWRKLGPNDKPAHFFTTTALYYDKDAKGNLVYLNGTFGLIGMHIIHKTKSFPDFVFATFEQVDVDTAGMQYVLLDHTTHKETGGPVAIVRQGYPDNNPNEMHPIPKELQTVTAAVQKQLHALNPAIPWQYYRLSGVQSKSVSCPIDLKGQPPNATTCVARPTPSACTKLDPNYFQANFVVESDPFLNNFSGPGFGSNPYPQCQNTIYNQQIYDNGGCKGCHGVAQTAFGTDFSFLLDFGNNKPSVAPATIRYYPPMRLAAATSTAPDNKKHYLDKVKNPEPKKK